MRLKGFHHVCGALITAATLCFSGGALCTYSTANASSFTQASYEAESIEENFTPAITDFTSYVSDDNKFVLSWNANVERYGYRISYSHEADGAYTLLESDSLYTDNSFVETDSYDWDIDIVKGVPYYFKVEITSYNDGSNDIILDTPVIYYSTELKLELNSPVIKAVTVYDNCILDVSWNGTDGASGYDLYRSTSINGTYSKVHTETYEPYYDDYYYKEFDDSNSEYSFAQKDLTYKQTYYYKVVPFATYNEKTYYGTESSVSYAKVSKNYIVPKLSNINVKNQSDMANISWNSNVTDYKYTISYSHEKNATYKKLYSGEADSYNTDGSDSYDYDAATGVYYYFKIRIDSFETTDVDAQGKIVYNYVNKPSKEYRTTRYFDSLEKPVVEISNIDSQGIMLSWDSVEGANGYYIYRSTSSKGTYKRVGTLKTNKSNPYFYSFKETKLSLGKVYYYKVVPYVLYDKVKYKNNPSDIVKKKITLNKVTIKKAKSSKPSINTITWNKVPKAKGYKIYYSKTYDGKYKKLKTIKGNKKTSYTHKKLKNGQAYYYKIVAYTTVKGKSVTSTSDIYQKYCDYYAYDAESYESRLMRIIGKPYREQYKSSSKAAENMVSFTVKVWDLDSNNKYYTRTFSITTHKNIAPTVKQIFKEIYNSKEKTPIHSLGCFNYSGTDNEHMLGIAIDVNPNENAMFDDGVPTVGSFFNPKKSPYSIADDSDFVRIMHKYGFYRGKWGSRIDYMHFSYLGT